MALKPLMVLLWPMNENEKQAKDKQSFNSTSTDNDRDLFKNISDSK